MARTRKPAEPSNPCKQCGARSTYLTPEQAGDDEGYHFMVCSAECGREPTWAKSKPAVIQLWNAENPSEGRSGTVARYEVTSTCNATVRTTYYVDAESPSEAKQKVKDGEVEATAEEVYGHQAEEMEAELIDPPVVGRKASKSKVPSKKGRS